MLGSAVLFAAVVIGYTAPIVHAGCGDYVVIGNPLQQTRQVAAAEVASYMPAGHSAPQPCHGPGCQQRDAFPPAPVPTVITSSPEFAAIPPAGNAGVILTGESRLDVRATRRVDGVLDRVERPPRCAAPFAFGSWRASA